ncbi:hypothetical protein KTS45_00600 [Halomicroarcula limicola]|uniref:Uncharacterized protein n=1 Tax=Haloarcula limicola TaxID=1429915 RepID=A0A8J7Y287_9EURY|nr:hypothetical protein [Halomicroarcula limicola]MBV0922687.1 hypothetical protein [Halomicroarcula limicola]
MTTRITTPTDEDAYPTTTSTFGDTGRSSRSDRAPMTFSPTSFATAGQFDTEADDHS